MGFASRTWTAGGLAALITTASAGVIGLSVVAGSASAQDENDPGHAIYEEYCGTCHNDPETFSAPALSALMGMSEDFLRASLTTGKMSAQGAAVPAGQFETLIAYLAPDDAGGEDWILANTCPEGQREVDLSGAETLTYQGVEPTNTRHMSAARAGLTSGDLENLEVAWVLGVPQASTMRSSPVIVGDTLFYSATNGYVLALDTASGCVKWSYRSPDPLRSSVAYGQLGARGPMGLVFTDLGGFVQAVNAKTGELVWRADGKTDEYVMLTGAPLVFEDKVIVPVSGTDVTRAGDASYPCCQGRGAVLALDAANGEWDWVAYTMEKAQPTGATNSEGTPLWGPSGAIVWSSPAIDPETRTIYAGTGENTSLPATKTSDAIWSIDFDTGETNWFFQALANDAWNMSCPRGPNCPDAEQSVRRDFDFGAGPAVVETDRGKLILGGQKSGDVWGVDEEGYRIWHNKYGTGSALGGIHWGIATNGDVMFAPVADNGAAGMYAVDVNTGETRWQVRTNEGCPAGGGRGGRGGAAASGEPEPVSSIGLPCRSSGLSAAPLSLDDSVIAATLLGEVVVFNSATGAVEARYNTNQEWETVNGVEGRGGSVDAQSIAAGNGMLFVGSGYPTFGQPAGNVLIAYRPRSN
jgi:polyvinyl alcohol dehydrogenase (cytochrome)